MAAHDIFKMPFAKVYSIHVQKAERKGWARDEVDEVILWLTGCSQDSLEQPVMREVGMTTFFAQAPVIVRRRRHVGKPAKTTAAVGWVERSKTHHHEAASAPNPNGAHQKRRRGTSPRVTKDRIPAFVGMTHQGELRDRPSTA